MVLFDLLFMTKTKIIVLVLLMVFFMSSYLNFSCLTGTDACGFLPLEFFVTFVWSYVFSCLIVESAKRINQTRTTKKE